MTDGSATLQSTRALWHLVGAGSVLVVAFVVLAGLQHDREQSHQERLVRFHHGTMDLCGALQRSIQPLLKLCYIYMRPTCMRGGY